MTDKVKESLDTIYAKVAEISLKNSTKYLAHIPILGRFIIKKIVVEACKGDWDNIKKVTDNWRSNTSSFESLDFWKILLLLSINESNVEIAKKGLILSLENVYFKSFDELSDLKSICLILIDIGFTKQAVEISNAVRESTIRRTHELSFHSENQSIH